MPDPYLSVETLKTFLGVTGTASNAVLQLVLDGVTQSIETYIGRGPLGYFSATEYYSPSGERDLQLDRFPLRSPDDVTAVYEDWGGNFGQTTGAFDSSTTLLTKGTDYAVVVEGVSKRAVLRRLGTVWPYNREAPVGNLSGFRSPCPGSVKVTYSAGFSASAPADVIAAAYAEAAARWKLTPFGFGVPTSESVAGASASVSLFTSQTLEGSPFITEALLKACRPYRRIPVGR